MQGGVFQDNQRFHFFGTAVRLQAKLLLGGGRA